VFNKAFQREDWDQAHFLVSLFIDSCRYHIPRYPVFYPWIVKAVCERHLGLTDAAEKSYLEARRVNPKDENVYGGLAAVYCDQQRWDEGRRCYEKATGSCCPPLILRKVRSRRSSRCLDVWRMESWRT
jgi:tetratricopeptide (TPR) repeat protein